MNEGSPLKEWIFFYLPLGKFSRPFKRKEKILITRKSEKYMSEEIVLEKRFYVGYVPALNKSTYIGYTGHSVGGRFSKFMELDSYASNFWPFTYWMKMKLYLDRSKHPDFPVTYNQIEDCTADILQEIENKKEAKEEGCSSWAIPLIEDSVELHLYLFYSPLVLTMLHSKRSKVSINDLVVRATQEILAVPLVFPLIFPAQSRTLTRAKKNTPGYFKALQEMLKDCVLEMGPFRVGDCCPVETCWEPGLFFITFFEDKKKIWLEFLNSPAYLVYKPQEDKKYFSGIYNGLLLLPNTKKPNKNLRGISLFLPPLSRGSNTKRGFDIGGIRESLLEYENLFFTLSLYMAEDIYDQIMEERLLLEYSLSREGVDHLIRYLTSICKNAKGWYNIRRLEKVDDTISFICRKSNIIVRENEEEFWAFILNPYLVILSLITAASYGKWVDPLKALVKLRKKLQDMSLRELHKLSRPIDDIDFGVFKPSLEEEWKDLKEIVWKEGGSIINIKEKFYKAHLEKAKKMRDSLIELGREHRTRRIEDNYKRRKL